MMKRLFIICICFMLLVAAVGCRAKISSEAEPGDTVAQEQPAITQESVPVDVPVSDAGNNQLEGDFIEVKPQCPPAYGITFRLPTDWVYEVIQSDDAPTSDLVVSIRPVFPGTEGVITLQHCDGFGVCGTGLVQKDIVFNGHEAWQGFYDGQSLWSFIALKDPKDCVIVNSADNWYEEYEEEINQILATVEFVYYEESTGGLAGSGSSQTDTKMSDELKKALIGKAEDETVDVYIYLQSKNAEAAIMDKMKDRYPDLYLVYENDDESHSDLQIQLALEKHRELSEEYYQELSAPIIKKISQNGTVIFASSYTPMLIATLSQNSMVEILNEDSVIWMDVFIDLNTSIEDESNP